MSEHQCMVAMVVIMAHDEHTICVREDVSGNI